MPKRKYAHIKEIETQMIAVWEAGMNMKERYPDYRWRISCCGILCNPQKGCEAKCKVCSYPSSQRFLFQSFFQSVGI